MRKFLLGLVCGLVVVGVANMGHAFWLFGGGGGGGNKHSSARTPSLDAAALFNFDFHQFRLDPKTGEPGSNNSVSNPFEDFLKLPELGSNHFVWNHDDGGQNFIHSDFDSNHIGNWQSGIVAGTTAPVPEPASMLLFGTGSIVFAGYLRKKLKK